MLTFFVSNLDWIPEREFYWFKYCINLITFNVDLLYFTHICFRLVWIQMFCISGLALVHLTFLWYFIGSKYQKYECCFNQSDRRSKYPKYPIIWEHRGINFFLIGIHTMQGWAATTRHKVTRKRSTKKLEHTGNQFRKNLQLKDVC